MEEFKVLITTSGIGSRLGAVTKHTNKSLVRVSEKPALTHIIELYPIDTKFVITIGHYGDHVKQYLKLAHPTIDITYVEIDNYCGPGSSLGYSILKCENHLKCPFIFHACDTILKEKININFNCLNWFYFCKVDDPEQYRTVSIENGKIIFNDKGKSKSKLAYIGLCGIYQHETFFSILKDKVSSGIDVSDVHVIEEMSNFVARNVNYDSWFDIGNKKSLERTRQNFNSEIEVLDKKDESIFMFSDFVIKFFSDDKICRNRVERAKKLNGVVPVIIDSTKNFYKYEKVKGELFSKSVNRKKFFKFLEWADSNLWKKSDLNIEEKCYDFYVTKTRKRIVDYLSSNSDVSENINGETVPSVFDMLDMIDIKWLCSGITSTFHGDFIMDNVIEMEDGNFKLIDWRQDFAGDIEYGDLYYDLAKLNHNLNINHSVIDRGLYWTSSENCNILINSKLIECKGVLHDYIKKSNLDLNKVKVLTALIWINMSPLHEKPFGDFLFKFGKYNLYKSLNLCK